MKRLSTMNVEVVGSTAAGAGRWWNWTDGLLLQFAHAAASFASGLASWSSRRPSPSFLYHFASLMRYLLPLHIGYTFLCYLLCALLRATDSAVVLFVTRFCVGHYNSVLISTRYGLDGPGIEFRWGEIFRTSPDRPRGPPSLLYNGYRSFPGVRCCRGVTLTPHPLLVQRSKNRVELYLYSL